MFKYQKKKEISDRQIFFYLLIEGVIFTAATYVNKDCVYILTRVLCNHTVLIKYERGRGGGGGGGGGKKISAALVCELGFVRPVLGRRTAFPIADAPRLCAGPRMRCLAEKLSAANLPVLPLTPHP